MRQGPNKDSIPENSKRKIKSIDLDQIDASIKSIRSAIAQTKITQKKLGIQNVEKLSLTFRDQGTCCNIKFGDLVIEMLISYLDNVHELKITNCPIF